MDNSKNKQNENLSVNKMGRSIRKSPLHQPNSIFNSTLISGRHHQPYPQVVYNINKDDFKEVVQKLTGSPSHVRPPPQFHNSPKPQSTRLQRIRPPPLSNVRSPAPVAPQLVPFNNALLPGGPAPPQFIQPSHTPFQGDMTWANNNNVVAESPISAYMRYFQNSMVDHPGSMGDQFQPQPQSYPPHTQIPAGSVLQLQPQPQPQPYPTLQTQVPSNVLQLQPQPYPPQTQVPADNVLQPHSPSSALFPNPPDPILHSPRSNGIIVPMKATNPTLPMNANSSSGDQSDPSNPFVPSFPSPQTNEPPILPSPTSQFPLPSPPDYNYMNILSPGSLYPPLLSPGTIEFISSLIPNFPLSPYSQPEILGPGAQPPLSPGLFPMSPTGLFPITSPRWGDE